MATHDEAAVLIQKSTAHGSLLRILVAAVLTAFVFGAVVLVQHRPSGAATMSSRLMSLSDLPAGWSVNPAPATSVLSKNQCLVGLGTNDGTKPVEATADFTRNSSLPLFHELLSSGRGLETQFKTAVKALTNCRSLTFTESGKKVHGTIVPLSLGNLGATSAAFTLSFTISNINIVADLVVFKTHSYVGEVEYADIATPQNATVEALAQDSVMKAEGEAVSTPKIRVSIVSARVHIAHTQRGNVAYREIGNGPPLVLIAGYGSTMQVWDRVFVDALAVNHRVVIFDNAGIGKTATLPAPLTVDEMANQTSALITTLGLKDPSVLGWSMGGMIAQALAVLHPSQVSHLVLCATYPGTGTVVPPQKNINALTGGNAKKELALLFPPDQSVAQSTYLVAVSEFPPGPSVSKALIAAQGSASLQWFNGADLAGMKTAQISVSTLVADGTVDRLDPVANAHHIVSLIPGSTLVLYPDSGHAFLFQDETAFAPAVESFLK
jgi:pimeloyl-ACP methyl ester carboxylesterase